MKYAIIFIALALTLLAACSIYPGSAWWLAWSAISFLGVALGYAGVGPRVFGKHSSGRIALPFKLLYLPYFAFTWLVWHLYRLVSREAAFNQIDDHLVIGRRLLPGEVPHGFDHYVDLTAEFDEPHPIRTLPSYHSLPILDASVPHLTALQHAVANASTGRVFVHCAQGHGRTGLFALALLLHRRKVQTIDEGLTLLQSLRPAVCLNSAQTAFAHRYLASHPHTASNGIDQGE